MTLSFIYLQRLKLLALIALFIVPLLVAWMMVEWRIGIPDERTAHGELVPEVPALSKWPLVSPRPAFEPGDWVMAFDCSLDCAEQADQWWRLHRALGREAPRVSRLRLGGAGDALPGEVVTGWQQTPAWHRPGQLWLLDPHGEAVLGYSADIDPGDVLDDLKRLLKMNP